MRGSFQGVPVSEVMWHRDGFSGGRVQHRKYSVRLGCAAQCSSAVKFYFVTTGPEGAGVKRRCVQGPVGTSPESFRMVDIGPGYLL